MKDEDRKEIVSAHQRRQRETGIPCALCFSGMASMVGHCTWCGESFGNKTLLNDHWRETDCYERLEWAMRMMRR